MPASFILVIRAEKSSSPWVIVSYRPHEVLTAGGSRRKLVSERSRPGSARSAFHAAQVASTPASWPPASTRWLSQRSRRYSHTRSTGLRRYGAGGAGERPSAPGTADGVPHAAAR